MLGSSGSKDFLDLDCDITADSIFLWDNTLIPIPKKN